MLGETNLHSFGWNELEGNSSSNTTEKDNGLTAVNMQFLPSLEVKTKYQHYIKQKTEEIIIFL